MNTAIDFNRRLAWLLLPALLLLAGCTARAESGRPAPVVLERRAPLPPPAAAVASGETLAGLSTTEQLAAITPPQRDLPGLVQGLNGGTSSVERTLPAAPPAYAIGDQQPFRVRNTTTNRVAEISATLVYSTPVAYIWVESGQPFERGSLERSAERFSTITYPNVVNAFGSEWRPGVDNDERLHILYNRGMGDGVAGYFSGSDEYTRTVLPFSNEKEMFYINLLALNRSHNYAGLDATLAHELQHMIHWHMDRGEELWLNEGLSEYAQAVAEFTVGSGFTSAFAADPDLQLTTWGTNGSNRSHYGAAYLFVAYLVQRYGLETLAGLVADPADGMGSVAAALAGARAGGDAGDAGDAEALFADWVVANYADQPDALGEPGRFGYHEIDTPPFAPAAQHDRYPVAAQAATVANFATDYIELRGDGDLLFTFEGATGTRLADAPLDAGARAWWANRADDADARLLRRYDLSALPPGAPLTLTASLWWDIERDYDFGYVMASADGEHWQLLQGEHMAVDNPSGNAFGPGYTGQSEGWVRDVFDVSAYAGGPLWLRFSYITDDAVNTAGWLLGDVQLGGPSGPLDPVGGSAADPASGWQSEGWLFTDNRLPQRWLLQVLEFDGDRLAAVRGVPVDEAGRAAVRIDGLGAGGMGAERRAVVAVSALAPATTLPASYTYAVAPAGGQ